MAARPGVVGNASSGTQPDIPGHVPDTAPQMIFGRRRKKLRLINLIRRKDPEIEPMVAERGEKDYVRLFHLGREVLRGVNNQAFIPNRGCWLCKDCEYDQDCREWTGNVG